MNRYSGPWLGIANDACNHYKIFAVEFDTGKDAEFGDPNDDHVGINAGAVVSFKTANSSEARVSLRSSSVHRAWIIYDGDRKWIDVHLGTDGDLIPEIPLLSSPLNLSPFLKEYMFVGFSASTGNSTQIHSILSWNFSSTSQAFIQLPSTKICHKNILHQVSKYSANSNIKHYDRPSSFLVFIAVLGLCTLSLLTFHFQSSQADDSSISLSLYEKKRRPEPPGKPRRLTVLELRKATRGFSKAEALTSSSSGVLYRGTLGNGHHVAVKRWSSTQSLRYPSRVLKRIGELTRVNHPSLAAIRGWCCESNETIVVYDHYHYGSMDRWLFGVGALPWTLRVRLIEDVAKALSHLHSEELAHGNLETSSVFLDADYRAVLGDYGFGLCEIRSKERDMGKREDVFQFGILVLEIVAGKKEEGVEWLDEQGRDKGILGFARTMYERGEMRKLVDERMGGCVNFEEAVQVLKMGLNCTAIELDTRPCMEEVLHFFNMMQSLNYP